MSKLYHFTRLKTAIEKILPQFKLKANNFLEMNDPRETYVWAFRGMNIRNSDNENSNEKQFKIGYDSRKDVKIICFTKEISGFKNELMWTHYGEKHKGICLEIDEQEFQDENRDILKEYKHYFYDVSYVNFRNIDKPQFIRRNEEYYKNALNNFINKHYDWLYFKKSNYWRQEDERRLVFLSNNFDGILSIKNSLKTIYLGLYTPEEYLPSISSLIDNTQINIQQCYLDIHHAEIVTVHRGKDDFRKFILKKFIR